MTPGTGPIGQYRSSRGEYKPHTTRRSLGMYEPGTPRITPGIPPEKTRVGRLRPTLSRLLSRPRRACYRTRALAATQHREAAQGDQAEAGRFGHHGRGVGLVEGGGHTDAVDGD